MDFINFRLVGNDLDALLQWQRVVIASHNNHGVVFQPLGEVHSSDGDTAPWLLKALGQFHLRVVGGFYSRVSSGELIVRPNENSYLGWGNSICHGPLDSIGHAVDFVLGIDDVWISGSGPLNTDTVPRRSCSLSVRDPTLSKPLRAT